MIDPKALVLQEELEKTQTVPNDKVLQAVSDIQTDISQPIKQDDTLPPEQIPQQQTPVQSGQQIGPEKDEDLEAMEKILEDPKKAFNHFYTKYKEIEKKEQEKVKDLESQTKSFKKYAILAGLFGAKPETILTAYQLLKSGVDEKYATLTEQKARLKDYMMQSLLGIKEQQELSAKAALERSLLSEKLQAEKEMLEKKLAAEKELELMRLNMKADLLRQKSGANLSTKDRARLTALDNALQALNEMEKAYIKERGTILKRATDEIFPSGKYEIYEARFLEQYPKGAWGEVSKDAIERIKQRLPKVTTSIPSAMLRFKQLKEDIIKTKMNILSGVSEPEKERDEIDDITDALNNASLDDLL